MICGNCGKEMLAGDKFCMTCGWRAPEETAPATSETQPMTQDAGTAQELSQASAPQAEVSQMGTAPQTGSVQTGTVPQTNNTQDGKEAKPKKKKGGKIVAALCSVAVVAGAGTAVALNWDAVTNVARSTFSSPEDYYSYVEKDNFSRAAASAADAYQSLLREPLTSASDMYESVVSGEIYEGGYSGEIAIELGDPAMEKLKEALEYNAEVPLDISGWNKIALNYEAYSKDSLINAVGGLTIGDTRLISLDTILDFEGSSLYLAIPELSETYLGYNFEDVMSDYADYLESMGDMTEYLDAIGEIVKVLPDGKQAQELLMKYFNVILGCVDDVDREKGVKLEAGGVSQKCTCLKVTVDGKTMVKVAKALCRELKDDNDVKKYITDLVEAISEQAEALDLDEEFGMELDAEEIYEQFQGFCDEILAEIEDNEEEIPEFELVMSMYIDSKGDVCGREFEIETEEGTVSLLFAETESGSKAGYKVSALMKTNDLTNGMVFEGSGTKTKGKLDGDFALTVKAAGQKMKLVNVEVKQFDVDALEQGYLNGSFAFSLASDALALMEENISEEVYSMVEDMELVIEASSSESAAKCAVRLNQDDELWAGISVSAEKMGDKKISVPSDAIMIEDIENPEDSIAEYLDTVDWDNLLDSLEEIGFPSEAVDELRDSLEMIEY